jgi:glycopeptide antibiotics resistance protein
MDRIRNINLVPFQGAQFGANEVYNILFFVPLGIYISMLKNKLNFAIKGLVILCCSLLFEIFQFVFSVGRSDLTDLICNVLGGVIGIGIYELLLKLLKNKAQKVMNIILLVFTTCILLFFVLLLTHAIPLRFNL